MKGDRKSNISDRRRTFAHITFAAVALLAGLGAQAQNVELVGAWTGSTSVRSVHVVDDVAYVADATSGLLVLDVSNPAAPTLMARHDTTGTASAIYVSSGVAYVADLMEGLQIFDVADPSRPVRIAQYRPQPITNWTQGVTIDGTRAYLGEFNGMSILDVSTPAQPRPLGSYSTLQTTGSWVLDIAVANNFAFVGCWAFLILDVSNPATPKLRGYADLKRAEGVYAVGHLVYMTDYFGLTGSVPGIRIVDMRVPSRPELRGVIRTGGNPTRLVVHDNLAYVADGLKGLTVVDVSDPDRLRKVGNYTPLPAQAEDVFFANGLAYLADGANGLLILRYTGPQPTSVGPAWPRYD